MRAMALMDVAHPQVRLADIDLSSGRVWMGPP
jgi:hypothetical protein